MDYTRLRIKFGVNNKTGIMEHKYSFKLQIAGKVKSISFYAPTQDGNVITNKYCPQELLTGGLPFVTAINGESIGEFISDCQMQVDAFSTNLNRDTTMEIHIGGLMSAITAHLNRCGRLIFGDLLIYMDCFSYLLHADGMCDKDICYAYPRILRSIVQLYADYIKNTVDLSNFKGSRIDTILYNLSKE